MKKLLLAAAILLLPTITYAQECISQEKALEAFIEQEADLLVEATDSRNNKIEIWVKKDNTYFLIVRPTQDLSTYCLVSKGSNFTQYNPVPNV
jgi:hypothetical protein